MALIQCKNCGAEVSDKARICPHCGTTLIEEPQPVIEPVLCEECGTEIPDGAEMCPKCGCPVPEKKKDEAQNLQPANIASRVTALGGISARTKKIVAIALAALVLIIGVVIVNQNTLRGDDKLAYEMVLDAASNFKDPSSVRLVSGSLGADKDCLFCGISATNGWGARSTSYYFIMGGSILEEDDPLSFYKYTDELHIDKINKKLAKALGSY